MVAALVCVVLLYLSVNFPYVVCKVCNSLLHTVCNKSLISYCDRATRQRTATFKMAALADQQSDSDMDIISENEQVKTEP